MAPSILVAAGDGLAHISRVLGVANILREEGANIVVGGHGAPWLQLASDRGYCVRELPPQVSLKALRRGSLTVPLSIVQEAVAADLALLDEIKPVVVLCDVRASMRLAAALRGIPLVAIINAHGTRHYSGPLAAPELHPVTRLLGRRLAGRLMPYLSPVFCRAWARPYRTVAHEHGHRGWADIRDYYTGDVTCFPDLPSLMPTRAGTGIYTGPLIDYPLPVEPLPALRDPVLYISMGSFPVMRFTGALLSAIGAWPGSVIATRGGQPVVWPEHWVGVDYADPFVLGQRGHQVAWLYHGGNGTSYQLLRWWVQYPAQLIGSWALPYQVEQHWNALKLQKLGVVREIGSLHRLESLQLSMCEEAQRGARVPRPPDALVEEVEYYHHAARRVAQEVRAWL